MLLQICRGPWHSEYERNSTQWDIEDSEMSLVSSTRAFNTHIWQEAHLGHLFELAKSLRHQVVQAMNNILKFKACRGVRVVAKHRKAGQIWSYQQLHYAANFVQLFLWQDSLTSLKLLSASWRSKSQFIITVWRPYTAVKIRLMTGTLRSYTGYGSHFTRLRRYGYGGRITDTV